MAEPKTRLNAASVPKFLDSLTDAEVRKDSRAIVALMEAASKAKAQMWGANIVGFGEHRSVYANGKEAVWMLIGFSPRKQNLTLYLMMGESSEHDALLERLGPHKRGKGCLYIKRLADIDRPTLEKLVRASVKRRREGQAPAAAKPAKR